MKPDESSKTNRLEDTVLQVSEHQNSMNMMDNIIDMPMMISGNNQQQITSVPMDTTGESIQNVSVAGPSTQIAHEQVHLNQNQSDTMQQEEEEESSEGENFEEECDADEGIYIYIYMHVCILSYCAVCVLLFYGKLLRNQKRKKMKQHICAFLLKAYL